MQDSWSPVQQHLGEYWSVQQCRWVACPEPEPSATEVAVPEQRALAVVQETVPA